MIRDDVSPSSGQPFAHRVSRALGGLALGAVMEHMYEYGGVVVAVRNHHGSHRDRFALARRAQHPHVERAGNLARPQGAHGRTAPKAPGGNAARCQPGQHVIASAPEDLVRREPQSPLRGRVPGHDCLVERHGVDAELGRFEQLEHVTGSHKLNCLKPLAGEAARRTTLSASCNDSRSPLCGGHHSRPVDTPCLGRCDARPFRCRPPISVSRRSCLTCSCITGTCQIRFAHAWSQSSHR